MNNVSFDGSIMSWPLFALKGYTQIKKDMLQSIALLDLQYKKQL